MNVPDLSPILPIARHVRCGLPLSRPWKNGLPQARQIYTDLETRVIPLDLNDDPFGSPLDELAPLKQTSAQPARSLSGGSVAVQTLSVAEESSLIPDESPPECPFCHSAYVCGVPGRCSVCDAVASSSPAPMLASPAAAMAIEPLPRHTRKGAVPLLKPLLTLHRVARDTSSDSSPAFSPSAWGSLSRRVGSLLAACCILGALAGLMRFADSPTARPEQDRETTSPSPSAGTNHDSAVDGNHPPTRERNLH